MTAFSDAELRAYAAALQRAIEHHCRGLLVPDDIAQQCPFHAKKLNGALCVEARRDAQAALAALKAEGVMLCRWEPNEPGLSGHVWGGPQYRILHGVGGKFKLVGLEPPAAALVVVPQYRTEMGAAAERYLYKVCRHAHPLPQQFKWEDCFNEMLAAALAGRKDG